MSLMSFSSFLFSLTFTVIHIYLLTDTVHSSVPLFLVYSFGKIKTVIKSILCLCLVCTVSAEQSWRIYVTMRQSHNHKFQVGLIVSQQSHCMSLVHSFSPLLEDDFITSYQTPNSLPSSCFLFHRIHHHIFSPASTCSHVFSFSFCYHR